MKAVPQNQSTLPMRSTITQDRSCFSLRSSTQMPTWTRAWVVWLDQVLPMGTALEKRQGSCRGVESPMTEYFCDLVVPMMVQAAKTVKGLVE